MGIYNIQQISRIIEVNPNQQLVVHGRKMNKKYMLHVHGHGMNGYLKRNDYFESDDVFKARNAYATSNVDLFKRVLNDEDQVFTTAGGNMKFGDSSVERDMASYTSDVIYGLSLQKWVHTFGLQAYRCDPMGLIFMEVEDIAGDDTNEPRCYPTYKSIQDIYDYKPNGRRVEYVCFSLTQEQLLSYGIIEPNTNVNTDEGYQVQPVVPQEYFRFVDDEKDVIVKRGQNKGDDVEVVKLAGQGNPIKHRFGKVPAFIASNIFTFDKPNCFESPLREVVELADRFLDERSVKDFHYRQHGFPKAVEPLMKCPTCNGDGLLRGTPCPSCTMPGQDKGTGWKTRTTPADIMKYPLEMLGEISNFDFRRITGYASPDVKGIEMMFASLHRLEMAIEVTYWGVNPSSLAQFNGTQEVEQTATKVLSDMQPKYARLNITADWTENCMNQIADFMLKYYFPKGDNKSNITLSRNYILETPELLLEQYHTMRKDGTPDCMMDDQFERYIRALYKSNPELLAMHLKLFHIEPFPHCDADDIDVSTSIPIEDKLRKRYFGEWVNGLNDAEKKMKTPEQLMELFDVYIDSKMKELQESLAEEATETEEDDKN